MAAQAARYLVVVVDGTAAMGPYWNTILSHYLEKIVRHFCGAQSTVELGVVQYNSHGSLSGCLVQASAWTSDINTFLEWLSALTFVGGGDADSAIAEGLAEALVMLPKPPKGAQPDHQQQFSGEKHCLLVAASNPFLLHKPLFMPVIRNGEFSSGIETELCMVDAQIVAQSFYECSISLSVISPRKLPKLTEIYNAGNNDPEGTPATFSDVNNPHFLVLLSRKFSEAHAALSQSGTSPSASSPAPEMKATSPDLDIAIELTEEDAMLLREILNEPAAASADHEDHDADIIPTETEQTAPQGKSREGESSGHQTMPTGRLHESQLSQISAQEYETLMAAINAARNTSRPSWFLPATPSFAWSSNNFQRPELQTTRLGGQVTYPNMEYLSIPRPFSGTAIATASIMPHRLYGGLELAASSNTIPQDETYVPAWEGTISALYHDQLIPVSQAKAYRKVSTPQWLTADWPQTLQMGNVLLQSAFNRLSCQGHAHVLIFEVMNHSIFDNLRNNELCARISLPSQSMIFSPGDYNGFIGTVFPSDPFLPQHIGETDV